jgi:hypothetical protein
MFFFHTLAFVKGAPRGALGSTPDASSAPTTRRLRPDDTEAVVLELAVTGFDGRFRVVVPAWVADVVGACTLRVIGFAWSRGSSGRVRDMAAGTGAAGVGWVDRLSPASGPVTRSRPSGTAATPARRQRLLRRRTCLRAMVLLPHIEQEPDVRT